jgi:hypothetical protein
MISCKLAKELKDAGFLQKSNFGSFFYDADGNLWLENLKVEERPEKECAVPTLAELIEAYGETFKSLDKNHTAKCDWWATAYSDGAIVCGDSARAESMSIRPM